jgi:endoplasmic reticulum Man9GlcNAc2 1,2-alpha-mannosidase
MYDTAMTGIHDHLVKRGLSNNLLYIAELNPERTEEGKMLVLYLIHR